MCDFLFFVLFATSIIYNHVYLCIKYLWRFIIWFVWVFIARAPCSSTNHTEKKVHTRSFTHTDLNCIVDWHFYIVVRSRFNFVDAITVAILHTHITHGQVNSRWNYIMPNDMEWSSFEHYNLCNQLKFTLQTTIDARH